jgi:hypothetical protein
MSNICESKPVNPVPINFSYHGHQQKRENQAPVPDNRSKHVYAVADRHQDGEGKKQAEKNKGRKVVSVFSPDKKNNEKKKQQIDLRCSCQ